MKFIFSLVVVLIVIFLVVAFPCAIDNAPDWVLLIPVAIGAFLLVKEIFKKDHVKSTLLTIILFAFLFGSCSQSSYSGLSRTQKQVKFYSTHKPTTNIFYDRPRAQWDR